MGHYLSEMGGTTEPYRPPLKRFTKKINCKTCEKGGPVIYGSIVCLGGNILYGTNSCSYYEKKKNKKKI